MDRNSLKWQNQIYIFFAYRTSIFYIRTIKSSLTVQCKYFMFSAGSSWGSLEPLASNRVGCCKLIHFVVSFFHISCCFAICTPFLCATWNCTYRQRDGNILETRCTPPLFQHVTNGLCRAPCARRMNFCWMTCEFVWQPCQQIHQLLVCLTADKVAALIFVVVQYICKTNSPVL